MSDLCRTLVADPPWRFSDRLPGPKRGAAKHYSCMSVDDICAFPLPPLADDALLFLWRVASMQAEALRVMRAWGFSLKSEMVWVKTRDNGEGLAMGMGHYVRASHEVCLIGRRGKALVNDRSVRSVFFAPRGRHSAKPDVFYDRVSQLTLGPRAELFARKNHVGFDAFGDQVGQ